MMWGHLDVNDCDKVLKCYKKKEDDILKWEKKENRKKYCVEPIGDNATFFPLFQAGEGT